MNLREQINRTHPVIGNNYEFLSDNKVLMKDDETACISSLLNLNCSYNEWKTISEDWINKTVKDLCENSDDADGSERIFRRRYDIR